MSETKKVNKKPPFEPFQVIVTSSRLNVRKSASKSGEVLNQITDHGTYTVTRYATGKDSAFGWGYLREVKGWVSLYYCKRV